MPYETEHACRLREPDEFKPDTYVRKDDRVHNGKRYSVLYARLKKDNKWAEQAYRYKTSVWTAAEARNHCEEHGGRFEEAEKDSQESENKTGSLSFELESPFLAILPEKLKDIYDCRLRVSMGESITPEFIGRRMNWITRSGTAIIPIYGYISQQPSLMTELGLETSSEEVLQRVEDAVRNSAVKRIILEIHSPGGTVSGLSAAAEGIRALRGDKKIYAFNRSLMASAAYFIGSAADKIYAAPESLTGSIGVISMHTDISEYLKNQGIKITIISSGKYKAEGNEFEPLSESAKEYYQNLSDYYYQMALKEIAKNRHTQPSYVKEKYGQGRVLNAEEAKAVGMIDGIQSWPLFLKRITAKGKIE